ncbi:Uncharacterized protein TCM_028502 [Theobroma cacao]|uniref:Uncharacterized protein n=1 Tax=Theobroma cacao TaxID=3641 RepID=A0A061GBW7_THECC|nr:Uncharacterized protein TCM_028502 [Theobroma cacao]
MLDIVVILGIDWLPPYYAILDTLVDVGNVTNVTIVVDYVDVFSKKLLRLPLDYIGSIITVIPTCITQAGGIIPISIRLIIKGAFSSFFFDNIETRQKHGVKAKYVHTYFKSNN